MAEITIGSDPEFIVLDMGGHIVPAADFFSDCTDCDPCKDCGKEKREDKCNTCSDEDCWACDVCRDEVGECHECNMCKDNLVDAAIGCDGCSDIGELRPMEASNPIEHHAHIKNLIHSIHVPDGYKLVAGTLQNNSALGGHIHIGYSCEEAFDPQDLANYLSYYCGIPLKRIERKIDLKKRGRDEGGYGYYGQYDEKDYGMEWRMPASWLVSSKIAKAALCLAHVVANDFIDKYHEDIDEDMYLEEDDYLELLDAPNINKIIKAIKKMDGYKEYKKEIKPIFDLIKKDYVWHVSTNFKELW